MKLNLSLLSAAPLCVCAPLNAFTVPTVIHTHIHGKMENKWRYLFFPGRRIYFKNQHQKSEEVNDIPGVPLSTIAGVCLHIAIVYMCSKERGKESF